jgi:hypothetical protein
MRISPGFRHAAGLLAVISVLTLTPISFLTPRTGPENSVASTPHGMLPLGNHTLILDGVGLGKSSVVTNGILVTG